MAVKPNLDPNRKAKQIKQFRMGIVADEYARGRTIRQIAQTVMEQMGLEKPPSVGAIHKDIQNLLTEWRAARIEDMDLAIQGELVQIDYQVGQLWEQWEKSKTDFQTKTSKKKGKITKGAKGSDGEQSITPQEVENTVRNEVLLGDPRYIAEIRNQQTERRKLLGLYAPEKKELSGNETKPIEVRKKIDYSKLPIEVLNSILDAAEDDNQGL